MLDRDRRDGLVNFQCDCCNATEQIETAGRDWPEVMSELRALGWKTTKLEGEWIHLCLLHKNVSPN